MDTVSGEFGIYLCDSISKDTVGADGSLVVLRESMIDEINCRGSVRYTLDSNFAVGHSSSWI